MTAIQESGRAAENARVENAASAFDPIELEILWKRLISVVDEASAAFVRTCFSTLVRDGNDFAIVLTDAKGRSLAQSTMSLPGFIGCLPATVRHFIERFPVETIKPGDVFITNDPWKGSGHVHDVTTATPIFYEGRLVAFAAVVSHLPDIGGKLRSNSSREIYEEGLQIPMMKLLEAGEPNETLIEIIAQNIRVPEQGLGDIWAQVSGCRTMGEQLQGLLGATDLETLSGEVRRRSENAMREAIRKIPDGTYRSTVQHDGFDEPIVIKCALTVKGDEIEIDYDGTSPQMPHALNVVPIYTFAYTVYGLKALLCPDIPNNEGSFLPITTKAPLGSLLNPTYPAASGGRSAIGHLLPAAVFASLAEVLPDRVWAGGSPNSSLTMSGSYRGRRFAVVNFLNAGQGATARRPGFSALSFPANLGNTPVEMMESLAPIRVLRREIRHGSGGKGAFTGGSGISFEFEVLGDAGDVMASFLMTQLKQPTSGLAGGGDGKPGQLLINGERTDPTLPRVLNPGDRVLMETAGGGGYGNPNGLLSRQTMKGSNTMSAIQRIDQNQRRSRAVVHDGLVYTAGQVPDDMDLNARGQIEQVLAKIDGLLRMAGTDKSRVLSAQVWLKSRDDLAAINAVWDAWVVPDNTPARICGMVAMSNPKCRVEIQVVAATG